MAKREFIEISKVGHLSGIVMKLTARQEAFLQNLIMLYQSDATPVHYTVLAEQLDVNRYTAYDMLKVLEKKGYVASQYRAKEGHSGPGRSEIVFAPTEKANHLFQQADTFLPDICLLYTSPSPRDQRGSRMPSSA